MKSSAKKILSDVLDKIDSVEMTVDKINILIENMRVTVDPYKTEVKLTTPIIKTK